MGKNKKRMNQITSIQYVHDPNAAKEWMDLFRAITKQQFIQSIRKDEK